MATNRKKKFSIVTPCFNAERYIEETVSSIIGNRSVQEGNIDLEYFVMDGGSTDDTLKVVEKALCNAPPNVQYEIVSEPDAGMYDALAKGLRRVSGDIVAYLNAGDFYSPTAFEVVADVTGGYEVDWLTGFTTIYNERSDIIEVKLPYRFRRRLFRSGFYGPFLPCLEQESTFWTLKLNEYVDFEALARCRLAGDFFLWRTFAETAELHIVQAWLGGFKVHGGQLSEALGGYMAELKSISADAQRNPIDYCLAAADRLVWLFPNEAKKLLNGEIFTFEPDSAQYMPARLAWTARRARARARRRSPPRGDGSEVDRRQ